MIISTNSQIMRIIFLVCFSYFYNFAFRSGRSKVYDNMKVAVFYIFACDNSWVSFLIIKGSTFRLLYTNTITDRFEKVKDDINDLVDEVKDKVEKDQKDMKNDKK